MFPALKNESIAHMAEAFDIEGRYVEGAPYGNGRIHATFSARYETGRGPRRYIHQRLNRDVFTDIAALINNIDRITRHQRNRPGFGRPADLEALRLIPTRTGKLFWTDSDGAAWRTYDFVQDSCAIESGALPGQAREAAYAFGAFLVQMQDLPGPDLETTIPRFHDTPYRFLQLQAAVSADPHNRAAGAAPEIAKAEAWKRIGALDRIDGMLLEGRLPWRNVHNDTKINNVLFDRTGSFAKCVIDLDTTMKGSALHDFGDLVRTAANTMDEDCLRPDQARVSVPVFRQLARGYLEAAGSLLNTTERSLLAFAGQATTLETGIRFLTDHLQGDRYFKTQRPGQNLERCRIQFAFAEQLERISGRLQSIVDEY